MIKPVKTKKTIITIGHKDIFAVEYEITIPERTMGYAKIWFGGYSLGTNEDLIFLKSYLLYGLEDIANSISLDFFPSDKVSLYKLLMEMKNETGDLKYLVRNFATFCDPFTIFSFVHNDELHILWKIWSKTTPFYDLMNQSRRVNYFKINKIEYTTVFDELKKNLYE